MNNSAIKKAVIRAGKHFLDHKDMKFELLHTKSRKRHVVYARQELYYLLRKHTHMSLEDIGSFELIGIRDHATVMHGAKNIQDIYDTDKAYRKLMDATEDIFLNRDRKRKPSRINARVFHKGRIKPPRRKLAA